MADKGRPTPEILVPYLPRDAFEPYHERTERWAVMVCHRRAGKTVAAINDLLLRTGRCERSKPRAAYIAPLHKQAKDAAWDYLKEYGLAIPGAEARETELSIELPNGGRVRLYGADNPDALRGIYLDQVVLDEYARCARGCGVRSYGRRWQTARAEPLSSAHRWAATPSHSSGSGQRPIPPGSR
jgi:hypothetical protein